MIISQNRYWSAGGLIAGLAVALNLIFIFTYLHWLEWPAVRQLFTHAYPMSLAGVLLLQGANGVFFACVLGSVSQRNNGYRGGASLLLSATASLISLISIEGILLPTIEVLSGEWLIKLLAVSVFGQLLLQDLTRQRRKVMGYHGQGASARKLSVLMGLGLCLALIIFLSLI